MAHISEPTMLIRKILLDHIYDRFFRSDHGNDVQLRDPLDIVNGQNVQWIRHREEQAILQARNRTDLVVGRDLTRQQVRDFDLYRRAREVDWRNV